MASQQMLLIILGILVIGIAFVIGISMFNEGATQNNRDAVMIEMIQMATRAQGYYRTPKNQGGGGNSFAGLKSIRQLTLKDDGINASYSLARTTQGLAIVGIGKTVGIDGINPVKYVLIVMKDSTSFDFSAGN